jgi:phosphoglycerate kinase
MIEGIRSIENENVKGKTVLLRVDVNSAVKNGKLLKSPKLASHAKTVKWLSDQGAKVVVLSHQGREGREDFIDLFKHREVLERLTDVHVRFFKWSQDYISAIKKMKEGDVIILDNTRFLKFESESKPAKEHMKEKIIADLAANADIFVLDALSVAHRAHATVIGFTATLPSFAGPVLMKELEALKKIESLKDNSVMILGGLKPEDSLKAMDKMLSDRRVSRVLLGGNNRERQEPRRKGRVHERAQAHGFCP